MTKGMCIARSQISSLSRETESTRSRAVCQECTEMCCQEKNGGCEEFRSIIVKLVRGFLVLKDGGDMSGSYPIGDQVLHR